MLNKSDKINAPARNGAQSIDVFGFHSRGLVYIIFATKGYSYYYC